MSKYSIWIQAKNELMDKEPHKILVTDHNAEISQPVIACDIGAIIGQMELDVEDLMKLRDWITDNFDEKS